MRTLRPPTKIKYTKSGLISIDQHTENGYSITYNPDDNRFHVTRLNQVETLRTFQGTAKGFSNAVQCVRTEVPA